MCMDLSEFFDIDKVEFTEEELELGYESVDF